MKIWNISDKEIVQLYDNKPYFFKPNSMTEVMDSVCVFIINKKELRGSGLIQLKDGDSKNEKYKQARLNMYDWAKEKWSDYEKHCEERQAQNLSIVKPHKEMLEYKNTIDSYEKWESKDFPSEETFVEEKEDKKKIFACPHCPKEFDVRVAYFGHLKSHQNKGENVNTGAVKDES